MKKKFIGFLFLLVAITFLSALTITYAFDGPSDNPPGGDGAAINVSDGNVVVGGTIIPQGNWDDNLGRTFSVIGDTLPAGIGIGRNAQGGAGTSSGAIQFFNDADAGEKAASINVIRRQNIGVGQSTAMHFGLRAITPFILDELNSSAYFSDVNVGIGTALPDDKLHIATTGKAGLILEGDTDNIGDSNTTVDASIKLLHDGGTDGWEINAVNRTNNNGYLTFNYFNGGTGDGYVGIGTSSPVVEAHVKDSSGPAGLIIEGNGIGELILRDNTGPSGTRVSSIRQDGNNLKFGSMSDAWGGFGSKLAINLASTGMTTLSTSIIRLSPNYQIEWWNSGINRPDIYGGADGALHLRTNNGNDAIVIDQSGNVNINRGNLVMNGQQIQGLGTPTQDYHVVTRGWVEANSGIQSASGTFTGNGSDPKFINVGFRPKFVYFSSTSDTNQWATAYDPLERGVTQFGYTSGSAWNVTYMTTSSSGIYISGNGFYVNQFTGNLFNTNTISYGWYATR